MLSPQGDGAAPWSESQSLLAADTDFLGPGAHDERVRRRADRAAAPAPAVEMPSLLDTDFEGRSLI